VQAGLPKEGPYRRKQPVRLYVTLVVVAIVGACTAVVFIDHFTSHPGGDPDGHMFAQLKAITSAILPSHAYVAVSQSQSSDAQWLSCPSSPPGSDGWTGPISDIQFGTGLAPGALTRRAELAARRQGWSAPQVSRPNRRLLIEWHRKLSGSLARLTLSDDDTPSTPGAPWFVSATAKAFGRQYDQHSGDCA